MAAEVLGLSLSFVAITVLICSVEVAPLVPLKDGKGHLKGSAQSGFLPLFSEGAVKPSLCSDCPCKAHHWNELVPIFQNLQPGAAGNWSCKSLCPGL